MGLGLLGALVHSSAADEVDDQAVARFVEVVNRVNSDWKRARPINVQAAARTAVGKSGNAGPARPGMKFADDLKMLVNVEARRTGKRPFQVATEATSRFVESLDPWSNFMDPAAWRQYQRSQSPSFSGVGMDIEKEGEGHFTCWPYSGSPAEAAGIKPGATLKAVNGAPVRGLSIFSVVSQVRGRAGEPVNISVSSGMWSKTVTIHRRATRTQTVFTRQGKNGPQIQITRFARGTANELQKALASVRSASVEIDLRACHGGDLDEAAACTGSFLPKGTPVCLIMRNRTVETLRSPGGRQAPARVVILQDRSTASSAELFIQALTSHGKAVSVGGTTKGKGTTQTVIPLSSGGGLVLTTGVLASPVSRTSWHGRGLPATR